MINRQCRFSESYVHRACQQLLPVGSSFELGDEEAADGAVGVLGRVEDDLGVSSDADLDFGILVAARSGRAERLNLSR